MQKNLLNLIVCITFSLLAAPDVISQCSIDDGENCESRSVAEENNSGDESDLLIDPT